MGEQIKYWLIYEDMAIYRHALKSLKIFGRVRWEYVDNNYILSKDESLTFVDVVEYFIFFPKANKILIQRI